MDPNRAEESCVNLGATAVTFIDAHDIRVWSRCGRVSALANHRLRALFADDCDPQQIAARWAMLSVFPRSGKPSVSKTVFGSASGYAISTRCASAVDCGSARIMRSN